MITRVNASLFSVGRASVNIFTVGFVLNNIDGIFLRIPVFNFGLFHKLKFGELLFSVNKKETDTFILMMTR